jgi:nucleotide-binding universal stress UspA family protein
MSTPTGETPPRIVVGVDGSASSRKALRWAVDRARLSGESVDAVIAWQFPQPIGGFGGYGWPPPDMGTDGIDYEAISARALEEAVSQAVPADAGVTVRQRVVEGHPGQVLLDAAEGADLLVVGSRGHGGFTGMLLGSVSQQCVHHAPCPVVVIRERPQDSG